MNLPVAIVVGIQPWLRRKDVFTVNISDMNSYLGGHHCKRCGRSSPRGRGAGDLPGGFTTPTVKMRASCGCWVLYCDGCMADTWKPRGSSRTRDIYWWHAGYGISHKRNPPYCGSSGSDRTT